MKAIVRGQRGPMVAISKVRIDCAHWRYNPVHLVCLGRRHVGVVWTAELIIPTHHGRQPLVWSARRFMFMLSLPDISPGINPDKSSQATLPTLPELGRSIQVEPRRHIDPTLEKAADCRRCPSLSDSLAS
ncbi:hypothetical protein PHLCEN_2v6758 [Hermanssonia centrifuga]|uniref:Uncharacterized protein n=1 Tax=Hermanssonia centrifuga TaxID=98765 RepID=A0A2R6NYI5_9APHY|nr:hypothetical protein PHLCEN_2v6758 [Hermanssonia centrifuga]